MLTLYGEGCDARQRPRELSADGVRCVSQLAKPPFSPSAEGIAGIHASPPDPLRDLAEGRLIKLSHAYNRQNLILEDRLRTTDPFGGPAALSCAQRHVLSFTGLVAGCK